MRSLRLPDAVKAAIGLDVKRVVPALKAGFMKPSQIKRELKERTLDMVCGVTNLEDFLRDRNQEERWALGDATAVAIAGIGEVQRRRVREMAK